MMGNSHLRRRKMKVLVACEFSGRVRDSFVERGHDAVSCDLLPSEGDPLNSHYQGDVSDILGDGWDLMIAFPPCTHLTVSGARWFPDKREEQREALDFVRLLMEAPIDRICIENPVGLISTHIRKPDQIFNPYQFGHGELKRTCLWLKNLPMLRSTNVVRGREQKSWLMWPSPDRAKTRSLTYSGVAEAMASQWGVPSPVQLELL